MKLFLPGRRSSAPTPQIPVDGLLAGQHVLVVDDDDELRRLVRLALEMDGALVSEADSLKRAVAFVEREPCDAVITDITLGHSRRDGIRLVYRLKDSPALARIPVIAMTGCKGLESELRGHGFDCVLIKPFEVFDLATTIHALRTEAGARTAAA